MKMRAKSIDDIASGAIIYSLIPPISMDEKAEAILHKEARQLITGLLKPFDKLTNWDRDGIEVILKNYATDRQVKFGEVAQPLRAILTGTTTSPDIFEVIEILGKEEVILRIKSVC